MKSRVGRRKGCACGGLYHLLLPEGQSLCSFCGGGRHLFAHGLTLDKSYPEVLAILDGLVDRAREPVTGAERAAATLGPGASGVRAKGDASRNDETGGVGRE